MAISYVRFQRGTLEAYQLLLEKNLIDSNTLYFIYADNDSTVGSLYMGTKLISGGETNYVFSTLDELSDVEVDGAESNSFLIKDSVTNNWIAKTPAQVAELIQDYITNSGGTPLNIDGDNLSVEIIDNIIQLKNYGTAYYAFVPSVKDNNNNIIEQSKYVLTEGFKAGLEPRVEETESGLTISWYEPNTEIIDNLQVEKDNIKISIQNIESSINELDNILNADDGLVNKTNTLTNLVGELAKEATPATGLHKQLEDLEFILNNKANIDNVYTKEAADKAIATAVSEADHLQRKIVNNINEIDTAASDAHLYIYMVPTGLQYEDDKYDEYVVINGTVERVGSWEVDLTNYATKDEINNLENLLNNKVDKIENHTLLSPGDQIKLNALTLDSNNKLTISTVNISDLESWLNENADSQKGLSENNLTDDLYTKISNILFISSVETSELNVDSTGKLSILEIDQNKITGLTDALNAKADKATVGQLSTTIDDINAALSTFIKKEDYDKDIAEIRDALTWKDIS